MRRRTRSTLLVTSISLLLIACWGSQAAEAPQQGEGAEESWSGSLESGLEFYVTFVRVADGGYEATLDIPAQGLSGYELSDVVYTDTEIAFTLPIAPPDGATWRATRVAGAETVEGEFTQGVNRIPFTMERLAAGEAAGPSRPQTPEPPFPYASREVTFANEDDGTTLAGTLTVPDGAGPHPAAVLISGSGPQDRDGEVFDHESFRVLADHLSRNGIAVLRYDDRGVGDSDGDLSAATSEDFAGDALGGVRFVAAQPGVDGRAVGLIGLSEGGIVAPMAAARSARVAFIVLLAGSGVPGGELMVQQLEAVQRALGRPEDNIAQQLEAQRRLMQLAGEGAELPELTEAVAELTRIQLSAAPEAERPSTEELEPAIEAQATQLTSPWWRFFVGYDPRTALRQVRVPVLALNGSLDTQVPADANLGAIREALADAGNEDVTVAELEGLNHLFQTAQSGSPTEYASIEETFAPSAMQRISEWINARFGVRGLDAAAR